MKALKRKQENVWILVTLVDVWFGTMTLINVNIVTLVTLCCGPTESVTGVDFLGEETKNDLVITIRIMDVSYLTLEDSEE